MISLADQSQPRGYPSLSVRIRKSYKNREVHVGVRPALRRARMGLDGRSTTGKGVAKAWLCVWTDTDADLLFGHTSFSLPLSLCVCVRVFFFCKTSVKIGCFGLAPLASVNSVYLALWCVYRCLIKLLVLNKVLSFPPLDTV